MPCDQNNSFPLFTHCPELISSLQLLTSAPRGGSGGGHSRQVWVEVCYHGLQTLTLPFLDKRPYFMALIHFVFHTELSNFLNITSKENAWCHTCRLLIASRHLLHSWQQVYFIDHIPQVRISVTLLRINEKDHKCVLALIPIQNVVFDQGHLIYLSIK